MYHILVVDDEARIRTLIRKYAEFEGHEVTEAGDGMSAVMLCRSNSYDLIIMDIMMPELDGFSACREIRKQCQTPIIMLSARGEEYDRINGQRVSSATEAKRAFAACAVGECVTVEVIRVHVQARGRRPVVTEETIALELILRERAPEDADVRFDMYP